MNSEHEGDDTFGRLRALGLRDLQQLGIELLPFVDGNGRWCSILTPDELEMLPDGYSMVHVATGKEVIKGIDALYIDRQSGQTGYALPLNKNAARKLDKAHPTARQYRSANRPTTADADN